MGRSQVEYNRKHGRGRGGRGRGGRSSSSNNNNNNNSSAVPRHLQPTASSKAKKTQDSTRVNGGASSPVPSYLAPTSASTGKTKPASPKSSSSGSRRSGWTQSSSSPSSAEQRKRPGRTQASPSQSPSAAQKATMTTNLASVAAAVMLPALSTTRQEEEEQVVKATPKRTPQQPPSSRFSSRKDPPADPLPDSPEQRLLHPKEEHAQPPPPSQSALLLYHTHSHVMYPKPHETPILQLDLDPDVLAKALEMSLPWYERLRLHTYVALAIDPDRDAVGQNKPGQAARTAPTRATETSGVLGDENDAEVDALLLEHTDTLVELESLNTSKAGEKLDNKQSTKKVPPHKEESSKTQQYSSSKSATGESAATGTSSAGESKLLQRARRYKQQQHHGGKPRSHGTSQEPVPSRKSQLPDPPADVYSENHQPQPQQQQQQQQQPHDWEIPPAMSDLTMPTALHSDPPKPRPPAATGVSVITRVLPTEQPSPDEEEEDDMDQWLDSALQSHDDDADDAMQVDRKPAAVSKQESTNSFHQEPAINLEAFAEDEEENMEDWLDSQIS